jgi:peptide/nickel transport system permease protein
MAGQITDTISGRATGQAALAVAIAPRRFDFFRRYSRERAAMAGLIIFLVFLFMAVFAPFVAPYDPLEQHISDSLVGPSRDYWLGTDKLGRDIFSRMVYGARISLFVGGAVVLIAGTFGSLVGLLAGYARGFADESLMRITDIFFAFPSLILAMAIAGALGPSLATALIAVAVVTWPVYARLVRGQVLVLREREFVQAAQVIGSSRNRILWRHLFPNTLAPLLVQASFDMGAIILIVAGLSFVGFGAQPPTPEWGVMISEGRNYITTHWWLTAVPALAMLFLVAAFNLIGDGLRDVLDPRLRK